MNIPNIILNDKNQMPQLGFGLWQVTDEETVQAVGEAFKVGYRSIDSAQVYQNEAGLGRAIANSGLKTSEMFITTKIWNSEHGFDKTIKSFDVSLQKLGLKSVDLLLIHWPAPKNKLYTDTWKALVQLQKDGKARSIGVSNFAVSHLQEVIDATGVVPAVNQIELHPKFQQKELRTFHAKHGIKTESWSPLGQGKIFTDPTLMNIAKKYHKSVAQVIIRWHLEMGLIVIPKSVTPSRIKENFSVFDFKLNGDDLAQIEAMDDVANGRIGPDPVTANF